MLAPGFFRINSLFGTMHNIKITAKSNDEIIIRKGAADTGLIIIPHTFSMNPKNAFTGAGASNLLINDLIASN